ncbi:hypothetical protein [Azospirillum sp. sgz301742]
MEIGRTPSAALSAFDGLSGAQARIAEGSQRIAEGELEPAVVVDILAAKVQFQVSAAVLKMTNETDKQILDLLA